MASLADNVARAIKVFDTLKAKVTNYVGIGSGNVSIPGSNIDTNHNISIETYVNAIDEVHAYGVEEGRQAQYDEFWDNYQQDGNRKNYSGGFAGIGWNDKLLPPKYPIKPTDAGVYMMFMKTAITDIRNIGLDTSKVTEFLYLIYDAWSLKYVGIIDCSSATSLDGTFMLAHGLISVDKIINVKATCVLNNMFFLCSNLVHVIFENCVFGQNGFSVGSCPKLDKESIISIFNALSLSTTGLTATFNKTAVNTAFGINVDDETTYTDEWKELMASKPNWNIAFANA